MKRTATIERYPVLGTSRDCVALWYRGEELTPRELGHGGLPHRVLTRWIPADAEGVAELRAHAKKQGFTHVRFEGWSTKETTPKGGAL